LKNRLTNIRLAIVLEMATTTGALTVVVVWPKYPNLMSYGSLNHQELRSQTIDSW
jgi:hypothetical protein